MVAATCPGSDGAEPVLGQRWPPPAGRDANPRLPGAAAAPEQVLALRIIVRRRALRVVLDTNTFVAAYWSRRSASAGLVEACEKAELQLLASAPVCREITHILRNAHTSPAHRERIARLLASAEQVHPTRTVRMVADDPDDDKFLECALSGDADYIVTNDDHLLRLEVVEGVRIVTPSWLARHRSSG